MANKIFIHEALAKAKIHEDLMVDATFELTSGAVIGYTLILMNYSKQIIQYRLADPFMSVEEFFKFVQESDINHAKEELNNLKEQLKSLPAKIKAQEEFLDSLKDKTDVKAMLQKFAEPS